MIVDSSAAAAVCLGEPDAEVYAAALETATRLRMSATTFVEAGVVIDARAPGAFDRFVEGLAIDIVHVDRHQADLAREAYRTMGRGSGHPARLNFGDCFSYALARQVNEPLLFKGDDFLNTDITPAIPRH
jgi:ribonuclease VapC